jgi:hypothetical protein
MVVVVVVVVGGGGNDPPTDGKANTHPSFVSCAPVEKTPDTAPRLTGLPPQGRTLTARGRADRPTDTEDRLASPV